MTHGIFRYDYCKFRLSFAVGRELVKRSTIFGFLIFVCFKKRTKNWVVLNPWFILGYWILGQQWLPANYLHKNYINVIRFLNNFNTEIFLLVYYWCTSSVTYLPDLFIVLHIILTLWLQFQLRYLVFSLIAM